MLLYNNPLSSNCYEVRLLASHLGIPLELRNLDVVDRSNRAAVLGELNPALRVPVLVLDDAWPLAESNAIIDYLAEGAGYLPADSTRVRRHSDNRCSSNTRSSRTSPSTAS